MYRAKSPRSSSARLRFASNIFPMILALAVCAVAVPVWAQRTELRPGFNLFSIKQDVQLGEKYSAEVDRQLPPCADERLDAYLNKLGRRLAAHAPGAAYPYRFTCVNDMEINAFALPGGFVYINRGAIEAADTEAQLAGILSHEIAHVALRHSTNHISKQAPVQISLALASGWMGGNAVSGLLTKMGLHSGMGLLFLKFSRTDEQQADVLGAQILFDSGYDPRALAQFFEKVEEESKRHRIAFLNDHPTTANRGERVLEEVRRMGGPPADYRTDSPEFEKMRLAAHDLPEPPQNSVEPSDR